VSARALPMRAMAPGSQTMIRKAVSIQALSVEAVGPAWTRVGW
jgi:hypothetical protein